MFKLAQLGAGCVCAHACMCVCVCGGCNLEITLHTPCMGNGRRPTFTARIRLCILLLSTQTAAAPLLTSSSSPWISVSFKAFLSPPTANCYLLTFVCSGGSIANNIVNSNRLLLSAGAASRDRGSQVRILIWRLRKVLTGPIYNKIILEGPAY